MQNGWIKLHRKIRENEIWQKEPFNKRSAWIDLLLRAVHKGEKFLIGNTIIELEAGQIFTSEKKLADDWKWSRWKVRCFLNLLKEIGQIETPEKTSRYTIITIANWELYQSSNSNKATEKAIKKPSKSHQKAIYKNEKNVKEIRYIINYLNQVLEKSTEKGFRSTTKTTQSLIRKRLSEGRTVKDFELVIKNRWDRWEKDENMRQYLTPDTLFAEKNFEKYLQDASYNNSDGIDNLPDLTEE